MDGRYPHVFRPVQIGPVEIANRFYLSPHGPPTILLGAGGRPTEDFVAYIAERAAGGVGLAIHSLNVLPRVHVGRHCPYFEDTIPAFAAVAGEARRHGTKMFGQLNLSRMAGRWEALSPPAPLLGASATAEYSQSAVAHALTAPEIEHLIEAFRRSARNLKDAGYAGIEIHCTHAMIIEQFLSPYFNKRTDDYGGSVENRMRLLVRILEGVRSEVGAELAVGVRYNCDEFVAGGLTTDDTRDILARLAGLDLLDFVDIDVAMEPDQMHLGMPNYYMPRLFYKQFAAAIRDAVPSVVLLCALVRANLSDAETAIAEGTVDLVGAARPLIAEPNLVKNARDGNERHSRTCIGTNLCLAMAQTSGTWGCGFNPTTGRERLWGAKQWKPASNPGKVVVVGGGPAGLEASRVAALRGHEVVLFEARDRLGGQLALWADLPGRESVSAATNWFVDQLSDLGVSLRVGVEATRELVAGERPDAIIVATGARYSTTGETGFRPMPIPGWDGGSVIAAEQVLEFGTRVDGTAVVFDDEGLNTAVGVAEILADDGTDVVLVTRWPQFARQLEPTLELPYLMPRLKKLGVKLLSETYIGEIRSNAVVVYDIWTKDESVIEGVTAVVMAAMRVSQSSLLCELNDLAPVVLPVGDAIAPRMLGEATYEGHRFARLIGEPDTPRDFAAAYWEQPTPASYAAKAAVWVAEGGQAL